MLERLQQLGFSIKEAMLYIASLELGEASSVSVLA